MDNNLQSLKLLHHFQVSPPPPPSAVNLPLTFLDYPWLLCRPMQRLFFYDFPHPTHHFTGTILPELKLSLSAALRHFFPLAGRLVSPPPPHLPHLLYDPSNSSVPLTVAESTADFDQIVSSGAARDATELRPFVPKLPDSVEKPNGTKLVPLLALQITIFPGKGLCVGGEFAHVVSDGMGFHHFFKFWAALFKSGDNDCKTVPLPSHDRELIRRAYPDLESVLLSQWFQFRSSWDFDSGPVKFKDLTDKVRSTFLITPEKIQRMKIWIRKANPTRFHLSSFVLTSAFIWVTLIKSEEQENDDVDELYHMSFVADCRRRLPIGLPETYFGNCLGIYYVSIRKSDAVSDEGVARAAEAIGRRIDELESDGGDGGRTGLLGGVERWIPGWKELSEGGRLMATAGSPKLKAYDTDFGWGKPRKSEVVQVDSSGAVSLCESGDGSGGIEVGLALASGKMAVFRRLFDDFLGQI
ncbi:Coumaroyl-CoA:anthocyanidin 3-O-glucoside-6''-O-coumaroyltransferase 2 [Linum grandiflorum]